MASERNLRFQLKDNMPNYGRSIIGRFDPFDLSGIGELHTVKQRVTTITETEIAADKIQVRINLNGKEFYRWKPIEIKPKDKLGIRTTEAGNVYFTVNKQKYKLMPVQPE